MKKKKKKRISDNDNFQKRIKWKRREKYRNDSEFSRNIIINGDAKDNWMNTGKTHIGSMTNSSNLFDAVYIAIKNSNYSKKEKKDLIAEVKDIETELEKGEDADQSFLERRLRTLKRMSKDIFDVLFSALGGPDVVISTVIKKILSRVESENNNV